MLAALFLLAAVFTASGASGLLFETLFFRQAGLAFGQSVWATSLVLSSFMAGLALGNGLTARFGTRIQRPVRLFAIAETAVALSGVALVYLLPDLSKPLASLLGPIREEAWLLNPVRLALAFILLLLPATAMGITLPVLVAALHRKGSGFGLSIGWLYGWNTLGAVLGALLGEMFFIGLLGVRGTSWVAAALDLSAAGAAFAFERWITPVTAGVPTAPPARGRSPSTAGYCLLGASFGAGWILLALEVVWFRFLHLFVHPGPATFSAMLAVVLFGIAAGGLLAGAWQRRNPAAYRSASVIALAAGMTVVVTYAFFDRAIEAFGLEFFERPLEIALLSVPLVLPTALLSGLLFTFTATALNERMEVDIQAAGLATLANTIGAGLGPLAAGFFLLPWLGMERSFLLLSALYGGVGALLLPARSSTKVRPFALLAAAAALGVLLLCFPLGRMRSVYLEMAARPFEELGGEQIVGVREGRSQTVLYLRSSLMDESVYYRLMTGAFSMSTSGELARRYMKLFVYFPIALNPDARSALLISYGVGATAKTLTDSPNLENIDIVEIADEVLEMGQLVYPGSQSPLADRRGGGPLGDGGHHLPLSKHRYDLITAEPPPPRHAGVCSLYSREHFQLIHDHLSEGGIASYWLPVHAITEETARSITRSFCDVFPDCSMWSGIVFNWMLVGSRGGRAPPSEEAMEQQWRDPRILPELRAVGIERPEQLGATFLADAEQLQAFIGDAQPLVDDFPKRIEDRGPSVDERAFYAAWANVDSSRRRFASSRWVREHWPAALRERTLRYFDEQRMIDNVWSSLTIVERMRELHHVLTETELRTLAVWTLGGSTDQIAAAERLIARGVPRDSLLYYVALRSLANRDYAQATRDYHRLRASRPAEKLLAVLELYTAIMSGDLERAADVVEALPSSVRSDSELVAWFDQTFGISIPRNEPTAPGPRGAPPAATQKPAGARPAGSA